ncbi:MAG: insulinase family protein, partial [Proteobacteria bacterium]|nr:insulinase family protein [Pseudomonadota bacterium]
MASLTFMANPKRRSFFLALILLTFTALAYPLGSSAGIVQPLTQDDGRTVVRERLRNGMTVIVEEVTSSPVVAIQMWVRVGSAYETEEEAGLSHVFEHMLFKGTEKRKVGELAATVEALGGDINAYTSFDKTVYHLVLPSRHFSVGLDVISDSIQNSAFDPDELDKELEVVLEELRMNKDRPGRNLFKSALSTSYSKHPYGRPVIGYESVIESLTRD